MYTVQINSLSKFNSYYHRLLRPINNQSIVGISTASLPHIQYVPPTQYHIFDLFSTLFIHPSELRNITGNVDFHLSIYIYTILQR